MPFKFEKLEVWQLALEYVDLMYELAEKLPILGMAIRSLTETVACQRLILRCKYLPVGEQSGQYLIEDEIPLS